MGFIRTALALVWFCSLACAAVPPVTLRSIPESSKVVLLVDNFHNRSVLGEKWDPWEPGIPGLLESDLLYSGYFSVVSAESRRAALKEIALGQTGLTEHPQQIGRFLGAKWILTGDYIVAGDQISLTARFVEVETARTLASFSESGPVSAFFSVAKKTSVGLMRQVRLDLTADEVKIIASAVETQNVEASLSNYRGESRLDQMERTRILKEAGKAPPDAEQRLEQMRRAAKDDFTKATQIDPGYERARKNLNKLSLMFPSSI
jgi:hypothetical protein